MYNRGWTGKLSPDVGCTMYRMIKKPLTLLETVLDRVVSVLGAASFSQIPEYMQQYIQRLGGHVDEARRQVSLIQETAQLSGKTLSEYIGKFMAHQDLDFQRQGMIMQSTIERARDLQASLDAIEKASPLAKPFVFLAKLNYPVAKAALANFQPAVPLTLENLVYALVGLLFALALYHFSVKSSFMLFKRIGVHMKGLVRKEIAS